MGVGKALGFPAVPHSSWVNSGGGSGSADSYSSNQDLKPLTAKEKALALGFVATLPVSLPSAIIAMSYGSGDEVMRHPKRKYVVSTFWVPGAPIDWAIGAGCDVQSAYKARGVRKQIEKGTLAEVMNNPRHQRRTHLTQVVKRQD